MRSPRSARAEDPGKLQVETRQKRCRQHITGLAGELDCATELTAFASIDSDDVHLGIDEPVFGYARSIVQTQLDCLVAAASTFRTDLDDQFRYAMYVHRRNDFCGPLVGHVQQVGL